MTTCQRKIRKIMDELVTFFTNAGSTEMDIRLKRMDHGYQLRLESDFAPEHQAEMEDLNRFLKPADRNEGLEEFYWELAGMSGLGRDSELHLIGQMIDQASVELSHGRANLVLFKQDDGAHDSPSSSRK